MTLNRRVETDHLDSLPPPPVVHEKVIKKLGMASRVDDWEYERFLDTRIGV